MQEVGGGVRPFEMPRGVIVEQQPWEPESGLVTGTLKVKREALQAKYATRISALYERLRVKPESTFLGTTSTPPSGSACLMLGTTAATSTTVATSTTSISKRLLAIAAGMNMFLFDADIDDATALTVPLDTLLVDSLSALRLARAISIEFGTELHVTALLESDVSLADIAARLETGGGGSSGSGSLAVDFQEEVEEAYRHAMAQAANEIPLPSPVAGHVEEGQSTVVLSGATGFVGIFLLVQLLQQLPPTITITCLVRADDIQSAFGRLDAALAHYSLLDAAVVLKWRKRVKPLPADLAKPRLGLAFSQFMELGASSVLVLHCGALVNAALPYSKLKNANVGGTIEMIRLAMVKPPCFFCFVSTVGVLPPSMLPLPEQDAVPPYHLQRSTGYAQSKWVAESVVREAFRGGLSGCVVRPANVFCCTNTGATNATDFVIRCLRGMAQLRCAPVLPSGVHVDVTPVDALARAVVSLCAVPTGLRGPAKHDGGSSSGGGDGGNAGGGEATIKAAGEGGRGVLTALAAVEGRTFNLTAGPLRMSVLVAWLHKFLVEHERAEGGEEEGGKEEGREVKGGKEVLRMVPWITWRTLLQESTRAVLEQPVPLEEPTHKPGSSGGGGGGAGEAE
jgi:thioester reductase-like protein